MTTTVIFNFTDDESIINLQDDDGVLTLTVHDKDGNVATQVISDLTAQNLAQNIGSKLMPIRLKDAPTQ